MRPQTIGLVVASAVTAVFLVAVAIICVPMFLPETPPNQVGVAPQPQRGFFQVGVNAVAPAEVDFPFEPNNNAQPLPPEDLPKVRGEAAVAKEISGPHTHGNLSVFLIHGEDKVKNQKILTLQEGVELGTVVVHDRGALFVDNRGNAPVFIQSGDIVKGGNQDRTLPFDMLIGANQHNVPIAALCVESGRSRPRGNELSSAFHSSSEQLPGRNLRLAAYRQNQGQVWANVQALQNSLARNVGGSVQAQLSQTSLQLSLEHPLVQRSVQNYWADLGQISDGKNDVIGYAVAVNGQLQSADVYASNAMFNKLFPKLLKASVVDALAQKQVGSGAPAIPSVDRVKSFLADAEKGAPSRVQANRGVVLRIESPQHLLFDTCDPSQANVVLHRAVVAR